MPRAKRTPRRRPEPDENSRELRKLAIFLEEAPGFHLGLATYDTLATRDAQLQLLAESVADRPIHLTRLDLTNTPEERHLLQRLRDHLRDYPAPEGRRPAVMVVGLEATIDYRKLGPLLEGHRGGPGESEALASLHNANFQRDAFPRLCPAPVVLWLSPTASTIFAQTAPDLWHWRSGSFHFTGPPDGRATLERELVATPLVVSDSLPRERKMERLALLRDLLLSSESADDRDTPGAKARCAALHREIGLLQDGLSDATAAIESHQQALELSRQVGDLLGEGVALKNLGLAYADLGQTERAIGFYEQALAIAREVGDRRGEGNALNNLGIVYKNLGHAERAIGFYEKTLAIDREISNRWGEGITLGNLGLAYADLGQTERAIGFYEQALAIAREVGDRRGEGTTLGNLGTAYAELGQAERAIGFYEQHLAIAREVGDRRGEGNALNNLGRAYGDLGQSERAIDLLEQALRIAEEIKDSQLVKWVSSRLKSMRGRVTSPRLEGEGGTEG